PVSGTLSPGNATSLYKFNANAGDPFFFDQQSVSGGSVSWRLIDPYGQQRWFNQYFSTNSTTFSDVPTAALPFTGTYTLLIASEPSNANPADYTFAADYVPLAAPIQITGLEFQPAPDLGVTGLAVSSNGSLQSGSQVTVSWNDTNSGNQATAASWT